MEGALWWHFNEVPDKTAVLAFGSKWHKKTFMTPLKVSATLKIAIFPYLRFQRFQIDMRESFLLKKNQKQILFLSKDIGGKRFFLVNYLETPMNPN